MSSGDPHTRQRILEEARRLMIERRGQNVRLEDIARAARVSRQALYLHFGSRTELLVATARYTDESLGLDERRQSLYIEQSGVQLLEAYVDFWTNYIPDIYGLARAFLAARGTDEAASAAWSDRMEAVHTGMLRVMRHLDRDGVLAPEWTIETAADFMWGTCSVATWENLTRERGWTNDEYRERMKIALKHALVRSSP
jgi:AcrR family transcriptional regulator